MSRGDYNRKLSAEDKSNIRGLIRERLRMARELLEIDAKMMDLDDQRARLLEEMDSVTNLAIADKFNVAPSTISRLTSKRAK